MASERRADVHHLEQRLVLGPARHAPPPVEERVQPLAQRRRQVAAPLHLGEAVHRVLELDAALVERRDEAAHLPHDVRPHRAAAHLVVVWL